MQVTPKTLSHSTLNSPHQSHCNFIILTVFLLKRLRGSSLLSLLWSKPPSCFPLHKLLHLVSDFSCRYVFSMHLMLSKSANGPIIHNKIQDGSSNPKSCPPASPCSVVRFYYHRWKRPQAVTLVSGTLMLKDWTSPHPYTGEALAGTMIRVCFCRLVLLTEKYLNKWKDPGGG